MDRLQAAHGITIMEAKGFHNKIKIGV